MNTPTWKQRKYTDRTLQPQQIPAIVGNQHPQALKKRLLPHIFHLGLQLTAHPCLLRQGGGRFNIKDTISSKYRNDSNGIYFFTQSRLFSN
eukprot:m.171623 g.171623  ORF g.171623 m.171623 type:complete len:91 (-) comp13499_c1_seq11:80-352(-)